MQEGAGRALGTPPLKEVLAGHAARGAAAGPAACSWCAFAGHGWWGWRGQGEGAPRERRRLCTTMVRRSRRLPADPPAASAGRIWAEPALKGRGDAACRRGVNGERGRRGRGGERRSGVRRPGAAPARACTGLVGGKRAPAAHGT